MQLFAEIFPLEPGAAQLSAYQLICDADTPSEVLARVGRAFLRRVKRAYPGAWAWTDDRLLTSEARSEVELNILLDLARDEAPDLFAYVDSLAADPDYRPHPRAVVDFALRTRVADLKPAMDEALSQFNRTLRTSAGDVRVARDFRLTALVVNDSPAVALSTSARLIYAQDAAAFAAAQPDPAAALSGLRVAQKFTALSGEIVALTGTLAERRAAILERRAIRAFGGDDRLIAAIQAAPDEALAVRVRLGGRGERRRRSIELPASALEPVVRPTDFARFGLDAAAANAALRPDPAARSAQVKALSDLAKTAGVLARAYSARDTPDRFIRPEFDPYLRFANKRTRPYKLAALAGDFRQCGAYSLRDEFRKAPIRAAVINLLGAKLDDYLEAMNRLLARSFDFSIDVLRERKVRVASLANVAAAVDIVEREEPDIVLVFMPDTPPEAAGDDDLIAYIRSLTLGHGLPAHVIAGSTLDDPESMPAVLLSILARTGNTPFALADPLDFADYVAGLDVVTHSTPDGRTWLTAVTRIYHADGRFESWAVRTIQAADDQPPYVLMRDIFPQRDFARARVVLHADGRLSEEVKAALAVWGKALGATFWPVEIVRRGAPRLYAFDEGRIVAPPLGSAFVVNADEAFAVLAHDPDQPTPQPVHLFSGGLGVERALHSLRAWMLLNVAGAPDGRLTAPPLPATLQGTGELAYWLRRGNHFTVSEGEVPFWL